jgi:hypothetical protein
VIANRGQVVTGPRLGSIRIGKLDVVAHVWVRHLREAAGPQLTATALHRWDHWKAAPAVDTFANSSSANILLVGLSEPHLQPLTPDQFAARERLTPFRSSFSQSAAHREFRDSGLACEHFRLLSLFHALLEN